MLLDSAWFAAAEADAKKQLMKTQSPWIEMADNKLPSGGTDRQFEVCHSATGERLLLPKYSDLNRLMHTWTHYREIILPPLPLPNKRPHEASDNTAFQRAQQSDTFYGNPCVLPDKRSFILGRQSLRDELHQIHNLEDCVVHFISKPKSMTHGYLLGKQACDLLGLVPTALPE